MSPFLPHSSCLVLHWHPAGEEESVHHCPHVCARLWLLWLGSPVLLWNGTSTAKHGKQILVIKSMIYIKKAILAPDIV